jgi:quinol---cytochrome-c reductase cytochrome b subunit
VSARPTMGKRLESSVAGSARWLDDRLTTSRVAKTMLNKIFPDHWSFMLGEIALYSFVVLVITGVFLTLFFIPSSKEIIYHGAYAPLRGSRVSEAYASTVDLSFGVRAGLVMRQMHHWACDVFVAAIVIHMCRVFFTGAFRRPRELNWIIGVTLLSLAIINGFIGYSLPDDLISGTGLRIAFSIILSIPVVGSYLALFIFGGNFPGDSIIPRFFTIHVLILPIIIAALLGAHLYLLVHHKHTQFPGKGRTNKNVVGSPFFPNFLAKTNGFFFMTAGALAALGGLAQINPIWLFGSYVPWKVSYAVQPDWYMGWLDGALRIMPSWETAAAGHTIPWVVLAPAVILPGLTFGLLYAWPFIESRFTKDRAEHHLLDRPRNRPKRTAVGATALSFYFVLFGASSTDVLANFFHISLNFVLWSFRVFVFVVPPIVGFVTYQMCKELQTAERPGKRKRSNIIVRSAGGGYTTRPAEARPGDEGAELEPEELPSAAAREPAMVGGSGAESGGDGVGAAEAAGTRRSRSGIFRVPRRS